MKCIENHVFYTNKNLGIKNNIIVGDKMCESTVYSTDGDKIMEDVLSIKINGEKIDLVDILGSRKELMGTIVEIDLDKHGIYINLNK